MLIIVAMVAYVVRTYAYTRLTPSTVWLLLAIEPLHGFTFALAWTANVDFMTHALPHSWLTTGMMLIDNTQRCIGGGIGAVVGGWYMGGGVIGNLPPGNGHSLYLLCSIVGGVLLVLHCTLCLLLRCCGRPTLLSPEGLRPKQEEVGQAWEAAAAVVVGEPMGEPITSSALAPLPPVNEAVREVR